MRAQLTISISLVLCLVASCANDAECPPGYRLQGYCARIVDAGPPAGDGDGDGDGDGGGDGDGDAMSDEDAGDETTADSGPAACALEPEYPGGWNAPCTEGGGECTCEANFCAVSPFTMLGTCTRDGCVDDPSICPDGYTCFDVAVISGMPGQPNFCFPPMTP